MAQTGLEWIIDAAGCSAAKLRDGAALRRLCDAIIAELDLHVVGLPQWHQFPSPGGWTGMYLLTESHLTIHTFPEHGQATLNLYCCRQRETWDWEARLESLLGADRVEVTCVERGRASLYPTIRNPQSAIQSGASR
jgi:S-adenosylmethionine decarboxylase